MSKMLTTFFALALIQTVFGSELVSPLHPDRPERVSAAKNSLTSTGANLHYLLLYMNLVKIVSDVFQNIRINPTSRPS